MVRVRKPEDKGDSPPSSVLRLVAVEPARWVGRDMFGNRGRLRASSKEVVVGRGRRQSEPGGKRYLST